MTSALSNGARQRRSPRPLGTGPDGQISMPYSVSPESPPKHRADADAAAAGAAEYLYSTWPTLGRVSCQVPAEVLVVYWPDLARIILPGLGVGVPAHPLARHPCRFHLSGVDNAPAKIENGFHAFPVQARPVSHALRPGTELPSNSELLPLALYTTIFPGRSHVSMCLADPSLHFFALSPPNTRGFACL